MSNFDYYIEGDVCYCKLKNGIEFKIDAKKLEVALGHCWYPSIQSGRIYLIDSNGRKLHSYLIDAPDGYEVDHINLDTLDNRSCNLRICTHQQNQMNQPIQRNNTSGVTGVSWYAPRSKYRARIKIGQHEIHLGYYLTFREAVQARNVGMECMFGEYGRYDDVPPAPGWIRDNVIEKCRRFANLSMCKAFFNAETVA